MNRITCLSRNTVALLVSLTAFACKGSRDPSRAITLQGMDALAGAYDAFLQERGRTPKRLQELDSYYLATDHATRFNDGWGRPYEFYSIKGELRSLGPDGKVGTADDIVRKLGP